MHTAKWSAALALGTRAQRQLDRGGLAWVDNHVDELPDHACAMPATHPDRPCWCLCGTRKETPR